LNLISFTVPVDEIRLKLSSLWRNWSAVWTVIAWLIASKYDTSNKCASGLEQVIYAISSWKWFRCSSREISCL